MYELLNGHTGVTMQQTQRFQYGLVHNENHTLRSPLPTRSTIASSDLRLCASAYMFGFCYKYYQPQIRCTQTWTGNLEKYESDSIRIQ